MFRKPVIVGGGTPFLPPVTEDILILDAPSPDPEVGRVASKPVNDGEDLLYLFSPRLPRGAEPGSHRCSASASSNTDIRCPRRARRPRPRR
jgi:hypothetical protein